MQTQDGIVILSGMVSNLLEKELAVKIAESIRGVRSVVDKIKVFPVIRKDEDISKDVSKLLGWDPAVDPHEVEVEVAAGIVTLKGKADSWQEKALASEVAKRVSGVKLVINKIDLEYKTERPDDEIRADILRRLETDIWIYEPMIQVDVRDGKVKLSGGVSSAREKRWADISSWVAGVKHVDASELSVVSGLSDGTKRPRFSNSPSDEKIQSAVKDAFLYDSRTNPFDLHVEVSDRFVVLSGSVDNLTAKIAAERNALNTIGVWGVENKIKVKPQSDVRDEDLAQYVRDALAFYPFVKKNNIQVHVEDKKVVLSGTLETVFDKKRAEDVASRISGIRDIDNQIVVESSWPFKSDQAIKDQIEREFFWSIFVEGDDIFVSVKDGNVKLQGTVDHWNELKAAVVNAFEGGARSVETRLKIKNGSDNLFVNNTFTYEDVAVFP